MVDEASEIIRLCQGQITYWKTLIGSMVSVCNFRGILSVSSFTIIQALVH